jgi:hypothetical protein
MRYAFVVAMGVLPWMRRSLPPRYWRKVVAAVQGVTLVSATTNLLPRLLMAGALAAALLLLIESFGRDVFWLWRRRPAPRPASRPAAAVWHASAGAGWGARATWHGEAGLRADARNPG